MVKKLSHFHPIDFIEKEREREGRETGEWRERGGREWREREERVDVRQQLVTSFAAGRECKDSSILG